MILQIILLFLSYLILLLFDVSFSNISFYAVTTVFYWLITIEYLAKYKRNSLFCFELFFAISFWLCSLSYPFFQEYFSKYQLRLFSYSTHVMSKAYIIAMVGYLSYMFALCFHRIKEFEVPSRFYVRKDVCSIVNISCFCLVISIFLLGGGSLLTAYSDNSGNAANRFGSFGGVMGFATIFYLISIVTNFLCEKEEEDISLKTFQPLFYVNTVIMIAYPLLSGLRSAAIQLMIPLVMMYGFYIKIIKPKQMMLLLLSGFILMVVIGFSRSGGEIKVLNVVDLFRDFIGADGALLYMVDHVDNNGCIYGSNMLFQILSVIPFLQSTISLFTNRIDFAPASSKLYTNDLGNGSGLGTNIIADLYYSFDLIGVIFFMFLLGYVLKRLSTICNGHYSLLLLLVLSGNALFAPRVEYFYIIRSMSFGVIFLWIITFFCRSRG